MKILLLIDNFGSGGAQRQIITLASLFKNKGVNVEFLTYESGDFFLPVVNDMGVVVHHIESKSNFGRIVKVRKQIKKGRYNAVVSFMDTPNFLNCISAIGMYRHMVVTCERSSMESIFYGMKHKIYNWFQRYSDAIVCNSENAVSMWKRYCPQYSSKLHCIYNAVILPSISSEYSVRKDGKTHIVVAASFQFLKNSINVAKAIASLPTNTKHKIVVDWYGAYNVSSEGSSCYEQTMRIIKENNLSSSMVLHSPSSDIASIMRKADCIALFSKLEGLPNAICEGMMIGKPIIMSRVSDFNILVDKFNGFLCDWNDIKSIAIAFENIANVSDSELLSMGVASEKKARELFAPGVITDRWLNQIQSLK